MEGRFVDYAKYPGQAFIRGGRLFYFKRAELSIALKDHVNFFGVAVTVEVEIGLQTRILVAFHDFRYDDPPKEMRPLKDNEVSAFLNAIIGHPLESLFYVATFTGMRESEIIGLSWDCIDFERGTIHLYRQLKKTRGKGGQYVFTSLKNKQARTFGVPQNVLDTLRRVKIKQAEWKLKAGSSWNNKDNLVFTDQLGKHIATHTVWRQFKVKAKEIGIPEMRFHDLRHSYATLALQNGVDVKTVSSNLGHATTAFTMDRYGHVTETMMKDSADKMQRFIESI